ncbi:MULTISPECIES: LptF/LptG family permease [unclassified Brevundimonas]|uniref:LptF/LptG family permease n=1 Tax=unclassified Brevundimonas TaxID=2622653 RepID=UPI0025C57432|nr:MULTISPECIES: LptF/LptG family permease [unclassified Brevundimonas]
MTLIQRYLFRQIGLPILAAIGALVGIGLLSQSLEQLEVIVQRGQSLWVMTKLTVLALPQLLAVILPIGLFVGALIALTRLQRDQELTAAYAAGMGRFALIRPAMALALIVTVIGLLTTTVLQPWGQQESRRQAFAIRTDLAALLVEEGRFVQGPDGLAVYVQSIEQNGLMRNLFVYIDDGKTVTSWDAETARFTRIDGTPVLTMQNGSMQRYSSRDVLNHLSFDNYAIDLTPYARGTDQKIRFKASDLWLTDLFNPGDDVIAMAGTRGELAAEGHSRITSPLYALVGMGFALSAILGGAFSRTGYTGRIARAAGLFLVVRVIGYGLVAAAAWNGWLNILQYLLPLGATVLAVRHLFRALKPRRHGLLGRLKLRAA